jgi:N-methylhydantoinase B
MVQNTPVEVLESKTGMRVEKLELRQDSAGAGKFRGGCGLERHLRFVSDGELLSVMKKTKTRPWSLAGGGEPEANGIIFFPGTEREKRVGTYREKVSAGDRAINLTAGGGGHGRASERDPQRVLEDVLDGYVSREAARQLYRVAIEGNRLDPAATRKLRDPLRRP